MKRVRLTFGAALLLFGLFVVAISVPSFAGEQKEGKAVAKDVKFACSQHGPTDMMLTLSPATGKPRMIEFIGGNDTTKWVVKIDGQDVKVDNGKTVKVRTGDSITWSVAAKKHGVVFAEQDLAQALLDFDTKVGKPLVDQTIKLTSNAWKKFGTKRWGTDPTTDVGVLASCKVK
jgi:plastocyanin